MSEASLSALDLPEPLPRGERLLWQGSPRWLGLARRALHVRLLAVYFAGLLLWRVIGDFAGGEPLGGALIGAVGLMPLVAAGMALPLGFAWLIARTTRYTITDRRVILSFGIAVPMSVNVPFPIVSAAAVKRYDDGTGDIPLAMNVDARRLGYLVMWPHSRPWRLGRPQPMLRCVPDAGEVAGILADALAAPRERKPS